MPTSVASDRPFRRIFVIHNPVAGRPSRRAALWARFGAALDTFRAAGVQVTVEQTQGPNDAGRLSEQALAGDHDLLLVAGGDGTLNEAIQPLVAKSLPVAPLPMGLVNVWAREIGLPRDPVKAAEMLLDGRTARVDSGLAGTRSFLLMAGLGFDAEVIAGIDPGARNRIGSAAYILSGARVAWERSAGQRVLLRWEEGELSVPVQFLLVGNSRGYGGLVSITPHALVNDGLLDVCVFAGTHFARACVHFGSLFLHAHEGRSGVHVFRCRNLEIEADPPLALQVDGDRMATLATRVSVQPASLPIALPRSPQPLLGERKDSRAPVLVSR